jgi:hypothetical protein
VLRTRLSIPFPSRLGVRGCTSRPFRVSQRTQRLHRTTTSPWLAAGMHRECRRSCRETTQTAAPAQSGSMRHLLVPIQFGSALRTYSLDHCIVGHRGHELRAKHEERVRCRLDTLHGADGKGRGLCAPHARHERANSSELNCGPGMPDSVHAACAPAGVRCKKLNAKTRFTCASLARLPYDTVRRHLLHTTHSIQSSVSNASQMKFLDARLQVIEIRQGRRTVIKQSFHCLTQRTMWC